MTIQMDNTLYICPPGTMNQFSCSWGTYAAQYDDNGKPLFSKKPIWTVGASQQIQYNNNGYPLKKQSGPRIEILPVPEQLRVD